MENNLLQLQYGDLVYIEINTLDPPPNTLNLILGSNSFFDPHIYAIKNEEVIKSSFINCIFMIIPSLIDNQDEADLVKTLEEDLDLLPSENNHLAIDTIKANIQEKKESLKFKEKSTQLLNEKILQETYGKSVRFGEIILLEHMISKSFLRAHNSAHTHEKSLLNLTLSQTRSQANYFKIMHSTHSNYNETVEFEVDVKIISFIYGTQLTIGKEMLKFPPNKLTNSNDKETSDTIFPFDSYRRPNPLQTFIGRKFPVGVRFEKDIQYPIKFYPYCKNLDLKRMTKNKIIKSGDFIRIQTSNFYLTASKSVYKSIVSFNSHESEEYPFHFIDSLFQVISIDNARRLRRYPAGEEIQANPKKVDNSADLETVYLKHFSTGLHLTSDSNGLFEHQEDAIDKSEVPYAQLIHANSNSEDNQNVKKNSIVAIRLMDSDKDKEGQYLIEGELERSKITQLEKNGNYYYGFNDSENHIKDTLKLNQKVISANRVGGKFYRIETINDNDLVDMLFTESYGNNAKSFMSVVIAYKNRKIRNLDMNSEMEKMLENSTKFLIEMLKKGQNFDLETITIIGKSDLIPEPSRQIFAREFKILNIINRLIYYFVVDISFNKESIISSTLDEDLDFVLLCNLIKMFIQIILISTKDNNLNHRYNSQFVRVYINAVIDMNGFIKHASKDLQNMIKSNFVLLLYDVLWDGDLDSLGQLNYYEEGVFSNLQLQENYELHYIQLLNHISKSKAPCLQNSIRDNFIIDYIGDVKKLELLLPSIVYNEGVLSLMIKRNINNSIETIYTSTNEINEKTIYFLNVLDLLNNLSKKKSLKFSQTIIKALPLSQVIDLINNPLTSILIKDHLKTILKNIHYSYKQSPIKNIPRNIQFIFQGHEKYEQRAIDVFLNAEKNLLHQYEINALAKNGIDLLELEKNKVLPTNWNEPTSFSLANYKDITIDLKDSYEHQTYQINNIYHTLLENLYLPVEALLHIHESIYELLLKITKNQQTNNTENKMFTENYEKIFKIIDLLDDQIVDRAMLQTILDIRDHVIKIQEENDFVSNKKISLSPSKSSIPEKEKLLNHRQLSNYYQIKDEQIVIDGLAKSINQKWKNKQMLYDLTSDFQKNTSQKFKKKKIEMNESIILKDNDRPPYLEDKFHRVLSNLIEKGNIKIASLAIKALQRKTRFESRVYQEMAQWAIINSPKDGESFILLIEGLLACNQIYRRIQLVVELNAPLIDNNHEKISEKLRGYLENIITTLYNYEKHVGHYNEPEKSPRDVFLNRLKDSKRKNSQEIPFFWNPVLVKGQYQRVMKILNAQEILVPLIDIFCNYTKYFTEDDNEFTLISRYVMIIIMLYLQNNNENQLSISIYNKFITYYYEQPIIESSVEMIMMFAEMCIGNKKLLRLSEKYLIDITAYTFIDYINTLTVNNLPANANNASNINYLRSLTFMLNANISKELFNPLEIMVSKFDDFYAFSEHDKRFKLETILEGSPSFETNKVTRYDLPILYLIWKEFLKAEVNFTDSNLKIRIITLQNKFPISKFLKINGSSKL